MCGGLKSGSGGEGPGRGFGESLAGRPVCYLATGYMP